MRLLIGFNFKHKYFVSIVVFNSDQAKSKFWKPMFAAYRNVAESFKRQYLGSIHSVHFYHPWIPLFTKKAFNTLIFYLHFFDILF